MRASILSARALLLVLLTANIVACGTTPQGDLSAYPEPVYTYDRLVPEDVTDVQSQVYDPWEGMNRRIYNFNYHFDQKVFLPVVRTWQRFVPGFARKGVHNFFNNIRDIRTLANSILQLKPEKAAQASGRVLVNSTVGLLGFVDVGTSMDLPRPSEDFGQTLGHWGVGRGPYLVIPFLGPSNLRDGVGLVPDAILQTEVYGGFLAKPLRSTIWVFDSIDTRSQVPFRYYETGSAFEYDTVRWLFSTMRDVQVEK